MFTIRHMINVIRLCAVTRASERLEIDMVVQQKWCLTVESILEQRCTSSARSLLCTRYDGFDAWCDNLRATLLLR